MNKIILYDKVDLQGDQAEFSNNVPDFAKYAFSSKARSLKVEGKHWVSYTGTNYTGQFTVYGAGDHLNLEAMDEKIQSLRLVTEDLQNPEIQLFENINYDGKNCNIIQVVNDLKHAGFENLVSSHKVKGGVWILCEKTSYTGNRLITFLGDQWPDYTDHSWNNKLSSLKPLLSTDVKV